jgi:hypothetical protein
VHFCRGRAYRPFIVLQRFNTVCYVIDVLQLAFSAELCTEEGTGQFRYQLFSREAPVPDRPVSFWSSLVV